MTTSFDSAGLVEAFKRARNAGVPLLGIETADQPYTCTALTNAAGDVVAVLWDSVRGLTALNTAGDKWLATLTAAPARQLPQPGVAPPVPFQLGKTADLPTALEVAMTGVRPGTAIPEDAVMFVMQAHRMIEGDSGKAGQCVQAVMNCRELLKERGATLVLLGPGFRFAPELAQDVLTLSEALPGEAKVEAIVTECYVQAGLAKPAKKDGPLVGLPDAKLMARIVDASLGLSAFAIEQNVSMGLSKTGANVAQLWDRKVSMINQTDGLSVRPGDDKFERLHGCEGAQEFIESLAQNWNPRAVLWWDEVEKAVAGYRGDNTGVSQDAMGTMLSWTDGGPAEGREVVGLLLMGAPGTGKSQFAKCCGSMLQCPTIKFDTGAMQSGIVGSSQRLIRTGLKVVDAVGQGRILLVATCNGIDQLPAELRRRFRYGLYYFDLPSEQAQAQIWQTWRGFYGIDASDATPPHFNWTGAEIKACCEIAARTKRTLTWAARKIVSIYQSNAGLVEGLRVQAFESGFIDAHTGDQYKPPTSAKPDLATPLPGASRKRNIKMES